MTLADLRSLVEDYLGVGTISASGDYLSLVQVDRAINTGLVEVYKRTKCARRTVTIAGVDDQAVYTLPYDMFEPIRVLYDGTPLTAADAVLLDKTAPDWQDAASSTPTHWLRWGATGIMLYPAPVDGTGDNLTVDGFITPSDITPATGTISLLTAATSTVPLPYAYQTLPGLYAVTYLAGHQLADDPRAQASGQVALREYDALLLDMKASLVTPAAYR